MNLDDLVNKIVITSEQTQLMQNPSSASVASATTSSSSSSSSSSTPPPPTTCPGNAKAKWNHALSTKKTIDEFCTDIIVDREESGNVVANNINFCRRGGLTLGETTLEGFLIRASVLSLGNQEHVTTTPLGQPLSLLNPMVLVKQHQGGTEWGVEFQMEPPSDHNQNPFGNVQFPFPIPQGGLDPDHHFQVPVMNDGGFQSHQVVDAAGYLDNRLESGVGLPGNGENNNASSDPQQFENETNSTAYGSAEKSILRRQRRMIKNRESAARSRAKKQAYTQQLEEEVVRLKQEIDNLRKRKEIVLPEPNPEPRFQLRRTSSAPPELDQNPTIPPFN